MQIGNYILHNETFLLKKFGVIALYHDNCVANFRTKYWKIASFHRPLEPISANADGELGKILCRCL